ncbi:HoxN/HupN/NixA family nickel/cobalt transporter [Paenibacillus sepulcri]|uniref:Nickel/cobalt efflux system n=1 Tax=Paenibacillus sepulcri TaxID=359917 RepID=A0ABS7CAE8_9BACL|nr:HoxN/HupN/NixA family nickel/cobalt transporter [Paenibacillus sepulcri]
MSEKVKKGSWIHYAIIIAVLHIAGLAGLLTVVHDLPAFWSMGLLAYTLGLRHAFDADHIAAIDNSVRKLVQEKRNALGTGFYFSLGHSSVVFLMVVALCISLQWAQGFMPDMQRVGGVIGMSVSGIFLLIVGLINLVVLVKLVAIIRKGRHVRTDPAKLEQLLESRGLIARLAKPALKLVSRSWHLYPLGFLFGLGFDTATEIGLLALSASAVQNAASVWGLLSLPLLFAAGMSLLDTADGVFMTRAYNWALITPMRKLYYNTTITAVSVAAALIIGAVELLQTFSGEMAQGNPLFSWVNRLNFDYMGYGLAALLFGAWLVSVLRRRSNPIIKNVES